jgi:multicomponent Na+:H+ antiporter subunit C
VTWLPWAVAAWLFLVGCCGLATSRNLLHGIICLSVCQSSTYVLLLAVGYRHDASAPVFSDTSTSTTVVDPVVQALVLTDVVVGAVVTAMLLALAVQVRRRHGTVDPDELRELQG